MARLVVALAIPCTMPTAAATAVSPDPAGAHAAAAIAPVRTTAAPDSTVPDTLRGRVVLGPDSIPMAGVTVALHRITTDSAGISDSVTTDGEGRFTFPLGRARGERIVYLASTRHSGVVYLGPPIHGDEIPDRYRVQAFETLPLSRSDTLPVATRHIVVLPEGEAIVARDLIDMSNSTSRTLVSTTEDGPWKLALPGGITEARVLAGGNTFADVEIAAGTVLVDGDIPPGGRRVPFSYRLPAGTTEWRFLHPTRRVEMHIREDVLPVEVTGLEAAGTSRIGEESYRRYAGGDLASGDVVSLALGGEGRGSLIGWVFVGLGGVFAAAAVLAVRRRRTSRTVA